MLLWAIISLAVFLGLFALAFFEAAWTSKTREHRYGYFWFGVLCVILAAGVSAAVWMELNK